MQTIITLWSPGSYGDQARKAILPESEVFYVSRNKDIVDTVVQENGLWIVPVSNPYGGEVWESWEALEEHRQSLIIAGSYTLPLDHAVVQRRANFGIKIRTIISHPQAYYQSRVALQKLYPNHNFVPSESTIWAVEMLENNSTAAICSAAGLEANTELNKKYRIVQRDISPSDNATKFILIATRESVWDVMNIPPSELDILRVTLADKPLQLAQKLSAIGWTGANIFEWGKAKANPGMSPLYTALLITSRIPRGQSMSNWFKTQQIEPITQKEDF